MNNTFDCTNNPRMKSKIGRGMQLPQNLLLQKQDLIYSLISLNNNLRQLQLSYKK